jgi:hypothetical protein
MIYKRRFKEEDSLSDLTDVELVNKLVEWFKANPFPKDHSGLHKFAEDNGYEADLVEQYVYAMLSLVLIGGVSKGKEAKADDENKSIGDKIEIEHFKYDTDNEVLKRMQTILKQKVRNDHLTETDTYYVDGVNFKNELKQENK